jgi:hypothetical protein
MKTDMEKDAYQIWFHYNMKLNTRCTWRVAFELAQRGFTIPKENTT